MSATEKTTAQSSDKPADAQEAATSVVDGTPVCALRAVAY
jgi:hypothetical protein